VFIRAMVMCARAGRAVAVCIVCIVVFLHDVFGKNRWSQILDRLEGEVYQSIREPCKRGLARLCRCRDTPCAADPGSSECPTRTIELYCNHAVIAQQEQCG
jgi:hypothetical protein